MQYEYKTEFVGEEELDEFYKKENGLLGLLEWLNKLGKDGWELISTPQSNTSIGLYIFKRQLPEKINISSLSLRLR